MGLFDAAQDFINRGAASVERGGKAISLKVELADANRQREQAYARLGERVFADLSSDAEFRVRYEELFAEIDEDMAKCADIEARIAGVEAEGAAARAAAANVRTCPACGANLAGSAKFCMNCGTAVPEATPVQKTCANCGNAVDEASQFCMNCGTKLN